MMNFKIHDLDNNMKITYLERKFVAADSDNSGTISKEEWRLGDFPDEFGPFEGHASCATSETCEIDRQRYTYYMAFHECASQGSRMYSRPVSEFPWSSTCPLVIQVENHRPFVHVENFENAEQKKSLEARGFMCWDKNKYEPTNICLSGYAAQSFKQIADRLQWTFVPRLLRASPAKRRQTVDKGNSLALTELSAPVISGIGADNAVFEMGLFSNYEMPWRAPTYSPSDFRCSSSLWENDGLVVVKRTALMDINLELSIVVMLITPTFVNFVVFIYLIVIVLGHIFWFLEKGDNALFSPNYTAGIIDGMWFAIVTMATVGYGDKVPITGLGKITTILWMFFGIISFGVFSGNVSSQIARSSLENEITGPAVSPCGGSGKMWLLLHALLMFAVISK